MLLLPVKVNFEIRHCRDAAAYLRKWKRMLVWSSWYSRIGRDSILKTRHCKAALQLSPVHGGVVDNPFKKKSCLARHLSGYS